MRGAAGRSVTFELSLYKLKTVLLHERPNTKLSLNPITPHLFSYFNTIHIMGVGSILNVRGTFLTGGVGARKYIDFLYSGAF